MRHHIILLASATSVHSAVMYSLELLKRGC